MAINLLRCEPDIFIKLLESDPDVLLMINETDRSILIQEVRHLKREGKTGNLEPLNWNEHLALLA